MNHPALQGLSNDARTDLTSNPLFLYLASEIAGQQARIDALEREAQLNRGTIVGLHEQLDNNARDMQLQRQTINDMSERLQEEIGRMNALVNTVDHLMSNMTHEELTDFFETLHVHEQDFHVDLDEFWDTDYMAMESDTDTIDLTQTTPISLAVADDEIDALDEAYLAQF